MKRSNLNNHRKALGNQGFSLLELIISIVILVIIMLPLMNNFFHSALINKKAEDIQIQSNLAASIMEGLKNLNIEEIVEHGDIDQFAEALGNPVAQEILLPDPGAGTDTYQFAINGIREGDNLYDVIITMKPGTYRIESEPILNSYPMPDAINLDALTNSILFSDGTDGSTGSPAAYDSEAAAIFLERGENYARGIFTQSAQYQSAYSQWRLECELAEAGLSPTPAPPAAMSFSASDYPEYCNEADIIDQTDKTMKIQIGQGSPNEVQYEIIYTCNWPAAGSLDSTVSNRFPAKDYSGAIEDFYLFYTQSSFRQDIIDILTPDRAVNFYLANQGTENNLPKNVRINVSGPDSISVYTQINITNIELMINGIARQDKIRQNLVKAEPEDRIYDAEVKIYQYIDSEDVSDKYQDELYSLSSATENQAH
jgi:prepilin-type N-terminal cleavage/methylation domain-containing protein